MHRAIVASLLTTALAVACSSAKGPPIEADYPLVQLGPHVYVIHGPNELPNKTNRGFINNPGVVLTDKGVVVIDPGSSVQIGEWLLKKIATLTKAPVIAVINTHIHGDHWLGNDAIRTAYPRTVIYAHPNMLAKAAAEGENWLKIMTTLTENATRGTRAKVPDFAVEDGETLALGGVHFRFFHTGTAHTDGDLMIEIVEDGVLFLGDNVLAKRVGRMDEGNFTGNMAAAETALKSRATRFVPGHGASGGREVIIEYLEFLKALYRQVKKYYAQGLADYEMKAEIVAELKPYQHWTQFDVEIGRLISLARLQIEAEAF